MSYSAYHRSQIIQLLDSWDYHIISLDFIFE